jgi:TPR repeat protein
MPNLSAEDIYHDESPEAARELLLKLAATGDHDAEFYLGHLADESSPQDQAAALQWYRKAAASGHLEAAHWAASFMYFGMGTEQDIEGALAIFRSCAESGLDASQWKLGQHLLSVPGLRNEALYWLRLAAAQGHTAALDILASESEAQ